MKSTPFDFDGRTLALSWTMEAMLTAMEKYGSDADILDVILAPTAEGWRECCWVAALMASQGELQRRARGLDPRPMTTMEELRSGLMAAEGNALRTAVRAAFTQGMTRELPGETAQQKEVNLVLQAREDAEKKTAPAASVLAFWRSLRSAFTSVPPTP